MGTMPSGGKDSIVSGGFARLVNALLTLLLLHVEAADPVALVNSLQVDDTILEASLGLYHVSLHLTTGPALDKVVTSGSGDGLKAWRYHPGQNDHRGDMVQTNFSNS